MEGSCLPRPVVSKSMKTCGKPSIVGKASVKGRSVGGGISVGSSDSSSKIKQAC